MKKLINICVAFSVLLVCAGSSQSAPIFFDDFDSYTAVLDWGGEGVWGVSDGTVDIIGEGTFWELQPLSYGLYVDMDGSTQDAGKITSPDIALAPGGYLLSFDVAGNWRTATDESMIVSVGGLFSNMYTLSWLTPFSTSTVSIPFNVPVATTVAISFEGVGSDNIGMLLDNVSLQVIPAPGAILLGGIGAGLVGWLRRRRAF